MWKKGDRVQLLAEGQRAVPIPAEVLMASSNQASLALGFDGVLAGHVGMMPVLRDKQGVLRSIINGMGVLVTCTGCARDLASEPHATDCPENREKRP